MCPVGRYRASLPPLTIVVRFCVLIDCTTTSALSQKLAIFTPVLAILKRSVSPSGNSCGPCTSPSAGGTPATLSGCPPFSDTIMTPLDGSTKTIPWLLQWMPYGDREVGHSVTGVPPLTGIFFSVPSVQNASDRPSGENVGSTAGSPPGISRDSSSFKALEYSFPSAE